MSKHHLAWLWLLCGAVACSDSVAPDDSAYADISALQVTAAFAQASYSTDSSAKFSYVARNELPRAVTMFGDACMVTVELQNLQGVTVFPSGARLCSTPLVKFRISARDSVKGTIQFSGTLGGNSVIGMFALPSGTFRMRVVIQGVTDTRTYGSVRVESPWSDPFTVSP